MPETIRTRFAPSPTGVLHLGHARAAWEAFDFARRQDGTCLLRIEDIDHTRCRPDYTQAIYADLDALGFDWPVPVRVQSRHIGDYAAVVIALIERGLAYPCALSRRELADGARTDPNSIGHGAAAEACERLRAAARLRSPSLPAAIRLNLGRALRRVPGPLPYTDTGTELDARPALTALAESGAPDPVIARRDIATSYHIAVTHDDHLQAITHVVRGEDLRDQTPVHVLIQTLMGWATPIYHHHGLVLRADGEKLAKRNLDTAIASLRESGQSAAEILRLAGVS